MPVRRCADGGPQTTDCAPIGGSSRVYRRSSVTLRRLMGRTKATRTPSGASSIYRGADGFWHGRVTVGVKDDGNPDRRHVMGQKQADVVRKVRELEKLRDSSRMPRAGQRWTVATWLTYWIDNIAVSPHIGDNTHAGYRVDVEQHLIPGIGAHRLEKLTPEHVERLYAKLQRSGMSAGTAHHVHRTLRAALNEAVKRGHLPRNPGQRCLHGHGFASGGGRRT